MCLNPYYTGILYTSRFPISTYHCEMIVLILIILEYYIRVILSLEQRKNVQTVLILIILEYYIRVCLFSSIRCRSYYVLILIILEYYIRAPQGHEYWKELSQS